ncbi:transmembrane protein 136-like isoform X1 [Papaver somniferum]|uniref:transmembrane protein 136-like isoform X1 n=1 Tax=Papaver somniferum TaxID=3469 RepID=UPI000E703241|nr:transmembrane protein 136-like isoform X1 [Papaver somniferum]XP_026434895.1 transmembrane protein 136-like isoform X1 [Papaver somniferum]
MEDYIVSLVVCGVISWAALFISVRKMFPKKSFSFCNRVVSTIHASLGVILASLSVQSWTCPVCPMASPSSPFQVYISVSFFLSLCFLNLVLYSFITNLQMQTLAVTLAYMIYDLICCFFGPGHFNIDNAVHHLVSIIGIGAGLSYQMCGSELVAALWVTEISSPFLHARELLKELGYKDTDLNLLADISFAVIFSIARMGVGPYITYITLSAENPLLIKIMGSGLQLVSAFWFYKIVMMVRYKLFKRNKASNKVN